MSVMVQSHAEPLRGVWLDPGEADALAVGLQRYADRLAVPIAAAASAFGRREGWVRLGYVRQEDYARERLGRTGRWLRQMAALGRAAAECPRLAQAINGDDGREPIGLVKALAIASVSTPDGVDSWIERAREVGVRQLERDVRRAREEMRTQLAARRSSTLRDPITRMAQRDAVDGGGAIDGDDAASLFHDDDEPRACVRLMIPRAVRVAVDEALELHRAVSGRESTIRSFVEALIADFRAGADAELEHEGHGTAEDDAAVLDPCRIARSRAGCGQTRAGREARLDDARRARPRATEPGKQPDALAAHPALREARALLLRAARLFASAGEGDADELHEQLRALIDIEDELQRMVGRLLREMKRWGLFGGNDTLQLPYDGVGHYARERLGVSRATAERLVHLVRGLERHEQLARAFDEGRVNSTAASLLLRALGRGRPDRSTERAWIERAERATIRRLRDEVRLTRREIDLTGTRHPPPPPNDETWFESLRREPGRAFERIVLLADKACRSRREYTGLFLRLPKPLAAELRTTMSAACRAIARERAAEEPWRLRVIGTDGAVEPFSAEEGSRAPVEHEVPLGVPTWKGLMRLLLGFAATHDPPRTQLRSHACRRTEQIYERDGYRCTVPGCTSRANLEGHHIVFRAQGGGDEPDNRTTTCQAHHHRGVHAGLISIRGRAPINLDFRLGQGRAAVEYRNDLRMS